MFGFLNLAFIWTDTLSLMSDNHCIQSDQIRSIHSFLSFVRSSLCILFLQFVHKKNFNILTGNSFGIYFWCKLNCTNPHWHTFSLLNVSNVSSVSSVDWRRHSNHKTFREKVGVTCQETISGKISRMLKLFRRGFYPEGRNNKNESFV